MLNESLTTGQTTTAASSQSLGDSHKQILHAQDPDCHRKWFEEVEDRMKVQGNDQETAPAGQMEKT